MNTQQTVENTENFSIMEGCSSTNLITTTTSMHQLDISGLKTHSAHNIVCLKEKEKNWNFSRAVNIEHEKRWVGWERLAGLLIVSAFTRQKIRHMGPTLQLLEKWKHIWKKKEKNRKIKTLPGQKIRHTTNSLFGNIYEKIQMKMEKKKKKIFYPDKRSVIWGQPTNLPCQQLPILLNISSIRGNSNVNWAQQCLLKIWNQHHRLNIPREMFRHVSDPYVSKHKQYMILWNQINQEWFLFKKLFIIFGSVIVEDISHPELFCDIDFPKRSP